MDVVKFKLHLRLNIYYGGLSKSAVLTDPYEITRKVCVPCQLLCPLCNQHNEDDWHVLFGCEVSIQAWQAAGLAQTILPRIQQTCNVADVIFDICSFKNKETAGSIAMLLWVLWNNRNNRVWNDMHEPGTTLRVKAQHRWAEWFSVSQVQHNRTQTEQHQQALDGRNQLKDGTAWMMGSFSIVEGESIALLEALKALEQRGTSHVIFEPDSKSVVDAIHHLRGANMVAHTLARAAISWSSLYLLVLLVNEMR
ncbi:hypothetical protein L195_g019476 [Trifolium pratense]|uniref:RNase H type-1 domain-containing protein n=1 Tax=Trifolium pratense TaxID=57577 RepID=A0A2K3MZP8_TRIPR|nr:hypothetical protein L195_g019476 [Trifolium pratense]